MSLAIGAAERGLLPDALIRYGIRRICAQRLRDEQRKAARDEDPLSPGASMAAALRDHAVAVEQTAANQQHYELPAAFFDLVLGKHRKYSCCYWTQVENQEKSDRRQLAALDHAEEAMLEKTCQRAGIEDGMQILDLGCGWGSFSLFAAERYPASRILAVSNSTLQREAIEQRIRQRNLTNVTVRTADVTTLELEQRFDRIVSIEMFEHMRNFSMLLARLRSWLEQDGRLFVHVFAHRRYSYLYEDASNNDWMARHFFTGGIMPSADLLSFFPEDLTVTEQWHVDGRHYEWTSNAWLRNLDQNRTEALDLMRQNYGNEEAMIWLQRWRIFFMACAELFAFEGGSQWGVEHYLLAPVR